MKLRSICVKLMLAVALSVTAPCVCAQDGLQGAILRANAASLNPGLLLAQTLAAADFDGDNRPDGAVLVDSNWLTHQGRFRKIELHFTSRGNADLTFESDEASLAILAVDVNRDGATDIVVEQPFTHKRVQVWLNDGHGGFRQVRSQDFPSADAGVQEAIESRRQRVDRSALGLPPPRGTEATTLAAQLFPGLLPSLNKFELFSTSSSLLPAACSLSFSRAPPSAAA
jgi:hypothetical protein